MSYRIRKQLEKDLAKIDGLDWCEVQLKDDSIRHWIAYIDGPSGTGYENYVFEVHLDLNGMYMGVNMKTKIYHLNIGWGGGVCLKVMDDPDVHELETDGALVLLEEIYELMKNPEPTAAVNLDALILYCHDIEEYKAATKMFAMQYAPKKKRNAKDLEKEKEKEKNELNAKQNNYNHNDNNGNDEKKDDDNSKQDDSKQN